MGEITLSYSAFALSLVRYHAECLHNNRKMCGCCVENLQTISHAAHYDVGTLSFSPAAYQSHQLQENCNGGISNQEFLDVRGSNKK